jgi:hypothetical protein
MSLYIINNFIVDVYVYLARRKENSVVLSLKMKRLNCLMNFIFIYILMMTSMQGKSR